MGKDKFRYGYDLYECPNGCKDGTCIPLTENKENIKYEGGETTEQINKDSGAVITFCQGCQLDKNTCIPFGTRFKNENKPYYCDITKKILEQRLENDQCDNNYECSANLCIDNKCISSSLIQKIIDWFKNLFGA